MKLRVRSEETKETLKLEVPNSCTLQELKQIISQQISSSSSPSSILVSLNRKDELFGRPDDSLQTLGITSGDLIFYSLNPNPVFEQTLVSDSPNSEPTITLDQSVQQASQSDLGMTEFGESDSDFKEGGGVNLGEFEIPNSDETLIQSQFSESVMEETDIGESVTDSKTQNHETMEGMDIDEGSGSASESDVLKWFSAPCFLKKVMRDELADDGSNHRFLVIALHAALLDFGFVPFDSKSNTRIDHFQLPDEWPSTAFTVSLWYTLPELIDSGSEIVETVVLKLKNLGQYIIVYGSLSRNGSEVHEVRLNKCQYASAIDLITAYSTSFNSYPEYVVIELWNIVKNELALPLLMDLCDRAGLDPPPCFMRLPAELKLKILEILPGVDLAKVGCVSRELVCLSSNNDLWKKKFTEEIGDVMTRRVGSLWKAEFASSWKLRKKGTNRPRNTLRLYPIGGPSHFPVIRDPEPFGIPRIIGGDYDLWPGLGPSHVYRRSTRSLPRHGAQHTFSPNCNLGGFSP